MSVFVRMRAETMRKAIRLGGDRRLAAIERGRASHWPVDGSGLESDIQAVAAEMVVGKVLGVEVEPSTVELDHEGDVGPGVQVRWRGKPHYQLAVHREDSDDHAFFLVRGYMPRLEVVGWMMGGEAKRPEWWIDERMPRPAFFVPDEHLHPAESWIPKAAAEA